MERLHRPLEYQIAKPLSTRMEVLLNDPPEMPTAKCSLDLFFYKEPSETPVHFPTFNLNVAVPLCFDHSGDSTAFAPW